MNWLSNSDPIMLAIHTLGWLLVLYLSFTDSGLRRRLRQRDNRIAALVDELMRLGVKVTPFGAIGTIIKRTDETEAFRQAYYIGSQWNLDRILDEQALKKREDDAETFVKVIKDVTAWKESNKRAQAREAAMDTEELIAAADAFEAQDDLAKVLKEYEQKLGVDTSKME